jgi:hypothetical protein
LSNKSIKKKKEKIEMRKLNSILWVIVIVFLFTGPSYGSGSDPVMLGWGAGYGIFWDMNTSEDAVLDANGPYRFTDWWTFNLMSMSNDPLPNPKITARLDGTLSRINASVSPPNPNVILDQTPPIYEWSMPWLNQFGTPTGWMAGTLRTNSLIPGSYALGYDVKREIIEGRSVPLGETALKRTFTMTLTPRDTSLSHIAASIDFTGGIPGQVPPVLTSGVSCAGPGNIRMNQGMPVFWSIGYPEFALEAGLTYTLTCTLNLTNSAPIPALFMPGAVVTGARRESPIPGTDFITYTSGLPDRLGGTVKFETGATGVNGSLDVIFSRSVIFFGMNSYDDPTFPTTTATISPAPNDAGWNNTPVTLTLKAADTGGSGVKQITYWKQLLFPGNPPPPPQFTPPISVPGDTATITDISTKCFTQVTYSAQDFAGNQEPWTSVTIRIDNTPPATAVLWTQPPPSSNSDGQNWWNKPPVTVGINAFDPCNLNPPEGFYPSCSGPRKIWYKLEGAQTSGFTSVDVQTLMPPQAWVKVLAEGTTTVTYYAEDLAGNFESPNTYVVNVVDSTPPTIKSVKATPAMLWPPNHKMVSIALSVEVEDNVTLAPVCRVDSVASNEQLNDSSDWEFSGMNLSLKAERSGNLGDRIYTVGVKCKDATGNDSTPKYVQIVVPHDQGKKK